MKALVLFILLTVSVYAQTDKTAYELTTTDIRDRAWLIDPTYEKDTRDSVLQGIFHNVVSPIATITDLVADNIQLDSGATCGVSAFTTTDETDTVLIPGALATDLYIVTGVFTSAIDQQDILQVEAKADTLIVHRMASGESALGYNWFRFTYK
ncbi:hypothetical protein KC717_06755 [Candidatus Dojkabacteria bacterium]|uniref:Lipocalin-like domain-containing protein n=1 Tax=Candidatus Dojkabacteria bacterium TaxID=2099670 RepID=A0A955L9W2_9BACT|nr:hypothetical protein [Candidatus Dojkabacteria bacterium]